MPAPASTSTARALRRRGVLLAAALALTGLEPIERRARADKAAPEVKVASLAEVKAAVKRPGARAVLVNVWATWCEPCKEEMPDLLRFYRDHKARGLRLVLVSADPRDARAAVARYLGQQGVDFPSYLKTGDDMAFIDGLDAKWDGTIPASILYDGKGRKQHLWSGKVTYQALAQKLDELLSSRNKPP